MTTLTDTSLRNQLGHQTTNTANICSSYSFAHENIFSAPLSYFRGTSNITKEIPLKRMVIDNGYRELSKI